MSAIASAFSVRRNLALLTTPPRKSYFNSIDGLRALATVWTIVMHCIWFQFPFLPVDVWRRRMDAAPHWVMDAQYAVDAFFVISGFLIGYILMKERRDRGAIHIPRFYARRFLKLMPAYFVALALYCVIIRVNWQYAWANVIYVVNFLPGVKEAMPWSWSLAIEEQFYFTLPCFLVFIFFPIAPRWRLRLLVALLALACAIRLWVAWAHNITLPIPWSAGVTDARFLDWAERLYIKPYTRFGCLLTGVIAAYLYLFTDAAAFFHRRRRLAAALFAISLAACAAIMAAPIHIASAPWPAVSSLAMLTLYPYVIGAATAYILLFLLYPANWLGRTCCGFLSLRIWYVLAQLAYSAYLLHPILFMVAYGVMARRLDISRIPMTVFYTAGPVLAFLVAMPLYLFVERPFMNLRDRAPRTQEQPSTLVVHTLPRSAVSAS
jgi:peptidoglycan/LPS O-acetylase OafA/YrhL